jgi:hypothetical protein
MGVSRAASVSDVGRVLRLDARRSALLLAVPVLALLGTAVAWHALIPGVAYWDNAVAAVLTSVRLIGPASATLAAWVAVRDHRLDYLRGLAVRSPAVGPLLDMLLLSSVALSSYGLVTLIISAKTMLAGQSGSPRYIGIVAGGLALAIYVILGYLAGRMVPHLVVVPVVAVTTALWSIARPGSWWGMLPPPDLGRIGLFAALRTGVLAAQALWSLALGAALVIGYVFVLTRRRWVAAPLAVAACVTLVTSGWIQGQHASLTPPVTGYACLQWPLTICVHPALHTALPTLEASLTPLATRLGGTPGAFTRVVHRPDDEPARPADGVVYIYLDDLSPGYDHRAEQEIEISLLDARACAEPGRSDGVKYSALVSAWLLDEEPPNLGDTSVVGRFGSWDEQERREWLQTHYWQFRSCTLRSADFTARP